MEKLEILSTGLSNTAEAPKGKDVFYRCSICGVSIPSIPGDNVGCECGNIFIDIDSFRLAVRDLSRFSSPDAESNSEIKKAERSGIA